jgi:hypothetical protein
MANSSESLDLSLVLLAVCLFGLPGEATAAAHTSTYVFMPEQSKVVQTGGIAYVHWTYSIKGHFQLTVDPNAGTASFAHVDANATDDSPFKRTLDLNHVFNMTSLVGTVEPSGAIKFVGKAPDDSDVNITVTLQDGSAHLIGQTTPPPNSADFFIFSLDAVAQRKYGGGSGTAEDPYQIATAEDLIALGETPEDCDKHFILTDDIDLDPNLPGRKIFDRAVIENFTGVFDGNGHAIFNLTIIEKEPCRNCLSASLGFFGTLDGEAIVSRLGLEAMDVNAFGRAGGLACENSGSIFMSYSTGTITSQTSPQGNQVEFIGGLVGINNGTITLSYNLCGVSGDNDFVGGLVGWNKGAITTSCSSGVVSSIQEHSIVGGVVGLNSGSVITSYNSGSIHGVSCVGGLVGENGHFTLGFGAKEGRIFRSYCTGSVSGDNRVGGLVGYNWAGSIAASYSTAKVVGTGDFVGGLVGHCWFGNITTSFWDIETSGQTTSEGGIGKTTAEMQTASTFVDAGWDFVNVWGIGQNQTYPYLRKYSAADINQDASVNFLDLAALAENWLAGDE